MPMNSRERCKCNRTTAVLTLRAVFAESDICDALVNEVGLHPDWVNAVADGVAALVDHPISDRTLFESLALSEHLGAVGLVIEVTDLEDNEGGTFVTARDNPFRVRVLRTSEQHIFNWDEDIIRPMWDVQLYRPHSNAPADGRGLWISAPWHKLGEPFYASPESQSLLVGHLLPHPECAQGHQNDGNDACSRCGADLQRG